MDYAQVEEKFKTLKEQFTAGKLDEAAFKTKLNELMVQDGQGHWWMIGYETGQWYMHDGTAWVRSDPPGRAAPAPAQPVKASVTAAPAKPVEEAKPDSAQPATPLVSSGVQNMPEMPLPAKVVKKMGWAFWVGWIGALGVGALVLALILSTGSVVPIFQGLVLGVVVGFIQWLIMRQYIRGAWWWILVNAIYLLIVGLLGEMYGGYGLGTLLLILYLLGNLIIGPVLVSNGLRTGAGG